MEKYNCQLKQCSVLLEPITPKPQTCLSVELHNAIEERNLLTVRSKRRLLTDLKELNAQCIERDRTSRNAKAIDELISSESSYVHSLKLIETFFMKPIKEQGILSDQDYETLFGYIPTIIKLNVELLKKLEMFHDNIAEVFLELSPFLKVYSLYAYYYKKSIDILLKAPTTHLALYKFLQLQESRPEVQQKLSALLISPIQRIPRYRLLLQQVIDNTGKTDPKFLGLKESLGKIEKIVEHIDSLVGHQENAQRLIELQSSMKNEFPYIIKHDRKLIKEGVLKKLSKKSNRFHKKYFILTTDILMYCDILKSNIKSSNSLKCKGILPLNKCEVGELYNNIFKIYCKDVVLSVIHKDIMESQKWVDSIKDTIKISKEHKRTLRKDSSSRRPVFGKLVKEYQEPGVSPGIPRKKRCFTSDIKNYGYVPPNISKQRCVRDAALIENNVPGYISVQNQDSLFPLRQHLTDKTVTFADTSDIDRSNLSSEDIYVFGNNNQDLGFRFKLSSIFTEVGRTLKKLFGFK